MFHIIAHWNRWR